MKDWMMFLFICVLISQPDWISAEVNEITRPLEEEYSTLGYTTIEEAVHQFEDHFKKEVPLPVRMPPISFTHSFGRFMDDEGDENDYLEIIFIHDTLHENHYKMEIRPVETRLQFRDTYILNTFILENKQKAHYIAHTHDNFLVFEQGNWQYILSVNKKITEDVNGDVLTAIANSISEKQETIHLENSDS